MGVLDGYLKRGEISDPKQMLPLLKELSNDERIPLVARNHASKLAAVIEKTEKIVPPEVDECDSRNVSVASTK